MNSRERFEKLMAFEPVDRLPVVEWASWWGDTLERWRGEGLPADLMTGEAVRAYFGQDDYRQFWVALRTPEHEYGMGVIKDMDDYRKVKADIFGELTFTEDDLEPLAQAQAEGAVIWITLEGFFWYPRVLFGIEPHMYAFYDQAELMHTINADLAEYHQRTIERIRKVFAPEFMTFAEDMSYNHGPMLSKGTFEEFLKPYYEQVIPDLKEMGTYVFIDTDGLIDELVPWCLEAGAEGFLPLERQAGVDIPKLRGRYPKLRFVGGFDKMTMNQGEAAMRAEFERLMPVMRQGGYVSSVDHQTPPGVSLADYRIFMKLLNEYARAAVQ